MESKNDQRIQVPRELPAMFRPPVNRAMRTLDRSFFRKTVPLSSAKIFKNSEISRLRKELASTKDLLALPRLSSVQEIKEQDGSVRKALLLRETLKHDGEYIEIEATVFGRVRAYIIIIDKSTWSPTVTELVEKGTMAVAPFDLTLEYDYWSYGMTNGCAFIKIDIEATNTIQLRS